MTATSKAQRMTGRERSTFFAALTRMMDPKPCEYGHYGCSTTEHGPCSNEARYYTAEGKREIAAANAENGEEN